MKRLHVLYVAAGIAAIGLSAFGYQAFGYQAVGESKDLPGPQPPGPAALDSVPKPGTGVPDPRFTDIQAQTPSSTPRTTTNALAQAYSKATTDDERAKIKAELKEVLGKIFRQQQDRRVAQIAELKRQLAELEGFSAAREQAKETIIDRRATVLLGGKDALVWEEDGPATTSSAARAYYPAPVYGAPYNSYPPGVSAPGTPPGYYSPSPDPRSPAPR